MKFALYGSKMLSMKYAEAERVEVFIIFFDIINCNCLRFAYSPYIHKHLQVDRYNHAYR